MGWWWRLYWGLVVVIMMECGGHAEGGEVTYDGRSLIIDGQRKMLFSGAIHYPRSTPQMWPSLIAKAKEGGLDVIQSYVFWNLHEPQPGQYDFSGRYNILVQFIKEIQAQGLYACLRIGPFIESEWNYGMEPQMDEEPAIVRPGPENASLLTHQQNHRSEAIWNGEDPGPLTCCGRSKEMANIKMQDNQVIDIIKLVGLEGLFKAPSKGIDHCLITALVERWQPETHTFHLPHGEMSITLEDVEVILGLLIDGEVLIGSTAVEDGDWKQLCVELLGFGVPANDNTTLVRQRIFISRIVQRIAEPLPHDATEMQIHQYARCYILALLGDKIFMDKSGDRVHLMFLEFLRNLCHPRQYSWGSGCLAWLYRELCRASQKDASQIGGALQLVQYWAWARLPFLCPRIEPPPGSDYGPWPKAPLAFKWVRVRVPSPKSRPSGMALIYYREQLVRMQSDQIIWQPYEADLGRLPAFCVAGRDTWTARVPLVCFCIVKAHRPNRVLRQFGLAQVRPDHVVYDHRLHRIDLRGKVEKNWREEHGPYILTWGMRQQRLCHAPPQIGEMPRDHAYYRWYRPVTRKYVDRNSAKLDIMIEIHLALLEMLPVGSRDHNHVRRVLNNVVGLGGGPAANGQANNGHETEPAATTTPSTSTTPLSTLSRGRRATATPSTSAAPRATTTASPSTSATRGRSRPDTTSPSTSAARDRGCNMQIFILDALLVLLVAVCNFLFLS